MADSNLKSKSRSNNVADGANTIECEGDFCNHCSFDVSAVRGNPIMRLCPVCNEKLDSVLKGKYIISMSIMLLIIIFQILHPRNLLMTQQQLLGQTMLSGETRVQL
jgi:hypothetical protein